MKPDRDAIAAALPAWNWQEPPVAYAMGGSTADTATPVHDTLRAYACYYRLDRVAPPGVVVRHALGMQEIAGYQIAFQSWQQPQARGTVLLLHGYYDHIGIFDHVIACVLAAGYDLLAFDLPGHGLSSGARATIEDFSEYQSVLCQVLTNMAESTLVKPWFLVAQSTGGAIFMDYLLDRRKECPTVPFQSAILLAPLVRPVHWGMNSMLHALLKPFTQTLARKFSVNSHNERFMRFLREEDPLQARFLSVAWVGALKRWIPQLEARRPTDFPLVVVQGDEDKTVDWHHNLGVIREKFPRVDIHMVPQGRHQLANESPELQEPVFAQIRRMLGER